MAVNIGPKIGIEGEAQFRKEIQQIITQAKTLDSQMKVVTSSFTKYTSSLEAGTKKSGVLKQQIKTQEEAIAKLSKGLEESTKKYGANDARTQKWAQAVNNAKASLNGMNAQLKEIRHERLEKLAAAGAKAGQALQKMGQVAGKVMKATGAAVLGIAGGIVAFGKSAVTAGMEFDSAMSDVAATMGKTVDEIGDLRQFAQDMGKSTAFSATEAANALNYMALAGYTSEQAMSMLPTVLNLAAAGGIDLASASDMVTDAQSALGLSMEDSAQMVDQMAQAASKSNTSVGQLGEAMLAVGATARSVKGGTAEIATILGVLADNGIKGAEGGTHFRNVLQSLSKTSGKGAEQLKKLGVSMYDADGESRSMVDVLQDLGKAMDGMSEAEKTAALSEIFNKTDLAAANALLGTSTERWQELSAAITGSQGAAETMASTKLDNLAGDITLFKSALEGAKIALSDELAPTLREVVQFATDGIGRIVKGFQDGGIAGGIQEIGNVLGDALGKGLDNAPNIIDIASGLLETLVNVIDSHSDVLIESGIKLIQSLANAVIKNAPKLAKTAMNLVLEMAKALVSGDTLTMILRAAVDIVMTLAIGIAEAAPSILNAIVVAITDPEAITGLINAAFTLVIGLIQGLTEALPLLLERIPELLTQVITTLCAPENLQALIQSAVTLVLALVNGITQAVPALIECVPTIITALIGALTDPGTLLPLIMAVPEIITAIVTGLLNAVPALLKCGADLIEELKKAITSGDFKKWGQDMIQGIIDGISGMIKRVAEVAGNVAQTIKNFLHFSRPDKGPLREYEAWMPDFMKGLARGIDANAWRVRDALGGLTGDMAMTVSPRIEPATSAAMAAGATTNMGGLTVNVYGTEGQSVDALADRVMDKINVTLQNSGRVWA